MRRQARCAGMIATLMLVAGVVAGPAVAAPHGSSARSRATAPASTGVPTTIPTPTLGLHQRFTEGFGRVRPRVVSYGGDPTSIVGGVHWRSWGGARAVGEGTADWVWPGWCVACGSVRLRATVVAFGLRSCGGHPAYAHVEWYFRSRGMTFSPRLGTENVCDLKASPTGREPPHARCAPVRIRGARVDRIEVIGYGVRCRAARRLVAHLGLLRHYHHNARFHAGRWWCGSELSMQAGAIPPQNFECQSGDYNDVSFDLTPTADVIRGSSAGASPGVTG